MSILKVETLVSPNAPNSGYTINSDDSIFFTTKSVDRVAITSTGYIGINTTTPTNLVTIAPIIKADRTVGVSSDGRLLVGTSSVRPQAGRVSIATSISDGLSIDRFNSTDGGLLDISSNRNPNIGSFTTAQLSDELGRVRFLGYDGSVNVIAADIRGFVDGNPGISSMPGRLGFYTTPSGGFGSVERMRIGSDGAVDFRDSGGTKNVNINDPDSSIGITISGIENAAAENFNIGFNVDYPISDSGVTGGYGVISNFTVPDSQAMSVLTNYEARGTAYGSGATVTDARGFVAAASLDQGATNVFGFKGNLASGIDVYNLYMGGTADNYFAGEMLCGYDEPITNYRDSQTASIDRTPKLQVSGNISPNTSLALTAYNSNDTGYYSPHLWLGKSASDTIGTDSIVADDEELGSIVFAGNDGSSFINAACIKGEVDGTPGSEDMPGRLLFYTTPDGSNALTERVRIDSFGNLLVGKTAPTSTSLGGEMRANGKVFSTVDGAACMAINRLTDDGTIVNFRQDDATEGTISVSGTTVTYNGGHLARWSRLPDGSKPEIYKGTVMTNLDEMVVWEGEDNEQCNKTGISTVVADRNVAGLFDHWDSEDDGYNDFYLAECGDFIIRIGAGVAVERGDFLESAGDGTARPQDSDFIKVSTVAKVTSTHVSFTYPDGSYAVPCLLK